MHYRAATLASPEKAEDANKWHWGSPEKHMGSRLSLLEAEPTSHEDFPNENKGHGDGQRGSRQGGSI